MRNEFELIRRITNLEYDIETHLGASISVNQNQKDYHTGKVEQCEKEIKILRWVLNDDEKGE